MVEVAPAPPGFEGAVTPAAPPQAPDSSAQLETAIPDRHPLEAWADPSPAVEPQIIRPLPGGSGYLNATKTALQRLAYGEPRGVIGAFVARTNWSTWPSRTAIYNRFRPAARRDGRARSAEGSRRGRAWPVSLTL
jgi:hypothetical protein